MEELQIGQKIKLLNGKSIEVISKLGEGGQGFVYKVQLDGRSYALKWYKPNSIKKPKAFKENLMNNIKRQSPNSSFVWPLAITQDYNGGFGYLMELIPEGYHEMSEFLIKKSDRIQSGSDVDFYSLDVLLKAAIRIVECFRILHNFGFSYQDLNDGNFFFHPMTGDVLICDNDNVAPYGKQMGVAGKCRYMSPAVVLRKEGTPDKHTDQFSMAVILFLLLLRNHPLEGESVCRNAVMTEQMISYYYGENPVFIADPNDNSNRPVRGIHNNFIQRWNRLPQYIQDTFQRAFRREVMLDNRVGVTEKEWLRVLLRFKAQVNICPYCGNETLYHQQNMVCLCCKKDIPSYGIIRTPYYDIPIFSKKELAEAYFTDCYDHDETMHMVARISMNSSRTKMSIQNISTATWDTNGQTIKPGERLIIEHGDRFSLFGEDIQII